MGFLSPWFLVGLASVGLPIWLHLLKRHRSKPLPFSSLMFFEQHIQSSIKHRRLRYLVLFALRTALLVLLALAFANPYITRKSSPVDRSSEVTLFAIDNSLSMRAGGRLAEAKGEAKAAIGRLPSGRRGQVIAFGSRVSAMSEVTDDHSALSAGVDSIQPSDARTSYAELSRAARSLTRTLQAPVSVQLFSDMQQSGMPANFSDLRLGENVRLEAHAAAKQQPNFAVENVVAPHRVYDARKSRVLATIASHGGKAAQRTVSLVLNGRVIESKQVEVPENGRASVEFLSLDVPHGQNKGEVRIDSADTLPDDDRFYFASERAEPRRALFVQNAGSSRALLYFRAALESAGESAFQMDAATPEEAVNISPGRYAFVVLSDVGPLPGGLDNQLRSYVRGGGSVLIALGHNSTAASKVPMSDARIEDTRYAGREGDRFESATWQDVSHPVILQGSRWDDVKFYQTVRVDPGKARVVAKLSDGSPLLMDEPAGDGRILVFASTLDNVANDFPLHPSFVPFVARTAEYLGRLASGPSSVEVGSFAELRGAGEKGSNVEVLDPKGARAFSLEEGARASNIQFTQAGFYEIDRPNERETVAVNADRRESDLTQIPDETVQLWKNTASAGAAAGTAGEESEKRIPLWWYVLIVALALVIAESLLGNKHLSVDKEAV